MQIINGYEVVCMQISELTLGFIASCIAGKQPSLKDIRSDVDKKSLLDHVEICFEEAMKRWCSNSIVRKRIAQRKFPTIGQLQVCYAGEDWKQYKYAVKSFVKAWGDELEKDFDCVKYIQQFDATESDEHLKSLIAFLGEEPSSEKPTTGGRGRICHEPVSGYIRRYCTSDHSDSDFLFYALGKKERHILADYVVGLECSPTNKFILYSSAQTGKTTDLKELCWELQESELYAPFSYEVRNNTKLKRENLPDCQYYGEKEVVVVIDALDEVNGQKYEDLIEEIGGYAYDHPEMKVLLSCRSNYRRERQLEIFKDLYLEELGGGDAQAHIDKQLGKAKGRKLTNLIIENQLHDFAKNPFFLNVLIDAYKADSSKLPNTKAEIYQLFIEDSYKKEKQEKNVQPVAYHSFDESVFLLERVALGMSLMNVQTLNRNEIKVCLKNDDANLEECLRYDLLQKEDEERYSFKHNSFREWLVAHYLSREGLDKAKQMATHPNGRIKPEWYNIIMLWVSMYGKDQKKEVLAILDWLKNASLDLVIYIDRDMLDENTRNNVFKGLLLEYKSLGIRMANILSQDYTNLLTFGQSEDTLEFMADEIAASEVGTAYYADLMCLCYFLEWSVWEKRNRELTEKLFAALEKKTKEALKIESSHDLSFLYFDNKFFTKEEYLERIYAIVKDSNHYEAIKSMIRLIDLADAVNEYLDYILEKEGYVHNQQEGTTTLVVSRTSIFTALSKVKSRDGVVKVLQHRFFDSRYAHSDEQEEYGKMMIAILGKVCEYIKNGDEELAGILENYYVGLFKDYHYQFDRDQHSQKLLQEFRTCYLNAGLREKGRDDFNARTGEIFRPREDKESKWDELHQIFSLAALWMTAEDVQADFGEMDSTNEYDWAKASWYREIPIPEVAQYASRLFDEKFPKPDRNTRGRERRIKSFQDFAEYAVFKQIVLEMVSGMDEHTTRRAYGKRLRELEEGYNQYAFRFFLHYPKGEEHCDTDEIIKGIKNRDVYESFFMKEIVGMLEHPDPDLTISEDIVVRCRETAKNNVLKICEGKYPVFFYEDSLKQMLKGAFVIPTEKLVNLLDYGFIHISRKYEGNFYSKDYSVFDYITEHVGVEQLSPLIIERLRKCVDKEGTRLSYPFAKYIVENGVEDGYDMALKFAFAGYSLSSNILEMLVKNGIKIEEIKAGAADMPVSDRLYCYLFLTRDAGQGDWVKQRLEAEFQTYEGYTRKRAVQQLLSMGSMEALDYLSSHTDIIRDGDDFHFNFDDTDAVPSLCYFIEYNDKHKMEAHFMLNSILTSLERIATKDKDSLFEVKNELGLLTQKGKQFQYLNRYIIAFEDKYYAAYSGIGDIKEAMKMVDEDEVVKEVWPEEEFVYISYSWKSDSIRSVEHLCSVLENHSIPFKRDRNDCTYMDNIKEFMDAIRAGKMVIVVFSRVYLGSLNCMYELSGVMEHPDFFERILPVVADDDIRETRYYRILAEYWINEKEKQEKEVDALKDLGYDLSKPEEEKLEQIEMIIKLLPTIKKYLDWTNTESLNAMCASQFSSILRKIRERNGKKEL
jgi:hypothetical protein